MTATTTTAATAARTILALDLSKYKRVACAYDKAAAPGRFDTLTTSRDDRPTFPAASAPPSSSSRPAPGRLGPGPAS
jgi:hypothetical protein